MKQHPRIIRNTALLTAGATAGITCRSVIKKDQKLQDAYEKFRERVKLRQTHHSIQSLFPISSQTRILSNHTNFSKQKSLELTTQLNAMLLAAPSITNEDGSSSELSALSSISWDDFLKQSSGDIYITFGHRKAFSATNPLQFTHAILYVCDSKGQHAIFGYTASKDNCIKNDWHNSTVSRQYTLYPDLTIKGNNENTVQLFKRIEHFCLQRYTVIGCNCYSPLISGLLESKQMGFKVPQDYNDSLLIVIPSEQNYGMGITKNRYLKPLSDSAVVRTQLFFEKFKEKTSRKIDEVKDSLQRHKPQLRT